MTDTNHHDRQMRPEQRRTISAAIEAIDRAAKEGDFREIRRIARKAKRAAKPVKREVCAYAKEKTEPALLKAMGDAIVAGKGGDIDAVDKLHSIADAGWLPLEYRIIAIEGMTGIANSWAKERRDNEEIAAAVQKIDRFVHARVPEKMRSIALDGVLLVLETCKRIEQEDDEMRGAHKGFIANQGRASSPQISGNTQKLRGVRVYSTLH